MTPYRKWTVTTIIIGAIVLGIDPSLVSADVGRLDIMNKISGSYQTGVDHKTMHFSGVTEGYDSGFDSPYNLIGIPPVSKVVSKLEDLVHPELDVDMRPIDSNSIVDYEVSIDLGDSPQGSISTYNELRVRLDPTNKGWGFGNETLTLQINQMNDDPNMVGNVYDLRKEIAYGGGTGVISLPDLNGTYNSEEVYGRFSVFFDRDLADFNNDGIVDFKDYAVLAEDYGRGAVGNPYNSLADTAIAQGNPAIHLPGTTTPYFDGVVDIADVSYFADNWLYEN